MKSGSRVLLPQIMYQHQNPSRVFLSGIYHIIRSKSESVHPGGVLPLTVNIAKTEEEWHDGCRGV